MIGQAIQCVWFKRDLRTHDHAALLAAAQRGPVIPLYIIEPAWIHAADFDAIHWDFIAQALEDLQKSLAKLGLHLFVEQGDALSVLARLQQQHALAAIWAHQETGNAISYQRDLSVHAWSSKNDIVFHELPQNGVVRRLKHRDAWARKWETFMTAPQLQAPQSIATILTQSNGAKIPSAAELGIQSTAGRAVAIKGGESAAWACLFSFIQHRGQRYHRKMSSPNTAYTSCSRLSAYLAWGCISMRSVVQTVRAAVAEGTLPKVAARAFLSRCHWHCHFIQKLESEPAIEFRAFNRACDELRAGPVDRSQLQAWQAGLTGYPFIDACMRALKKHGWINFRMRAMLVSFAAYHLWLDWRHFKDWLACQFIDYEPGIHYSQIQMQSGLTGINTVRIYNPIKQGYDQDPQGDFIRKWVPELAAYKGELVHNPWQHAGELNLVPVKSRIDYPVPIVEHTVAVRAARQHFSQLRNNVDYWEQAAQVLQRHGSRRRNRRASPRRPQKLDRPTSDASEQCEFSFETRCEAPACDSSSRGEQSPE